MVPALTTVSAREMRRRHRASDDNSAGQRTCSLSSITVVDHPSRGEPQTPEERESGYRGKGEVAFAAWFGAAEGRRAPFGTDGSVGSDPRAAGRDRAVEFLEQLGLVVAVPLETIRSAVVG